MPYKIRIDICSNCSSHKWCTRHNEATYLQMANQLKSSITGNIDDAQVSVHQVGQLGGEHLGSFQVSCEGVTLFSKLQLRYFPHTTLLTNRIVKFIDDLKQGNDISKYKEPNSPIKHHPMFKKQASPSPKKTKQPSNIVLMPDSTSKVVESHKKQEKKEEIKKEEKKEDKKQDKVEEKKEEKKEPVKNYPISDHKEPVKKEEAPSPAKKQQKIEEKKESPEKPKETQPENKNVQSHPTPKQAEVKQQPVKEEKKEEKEEIPAQAKQQQSKQKPEEAEKAPEAVEAEPIKESKEVPAATSGQGNEQKGEKESPKGENLVQAQNN